MKKRWIAVATLKAEERMHRVPGAFGIVALIKNMEVIVREKQKILDVLAL